AAGSALPRALGRGMEGAGRGVTIAMPTTRRELLAACAGGVLAVSPRTSQADPPAAGRPKRLGVVINSYTIRVAAGSARGGGPGFDDPLAFLDYCHDLGAGGVQVGIGAREAEPIARLRRKVEDFAMYLEGTIRLPGDRADEARFADEVRTASQAGAAVLRA